MLRVKGEKAGTLLSVADGWLMHTGRRVYVEVYKIKKPPLMRDGFAKN